MGDREEEETQCWTLQASRHKMALWRLQLDWRIKQPASSGGSTGFSIFAMKGSTSRIFETFVANNIKRLVLSNLFDDQLHHISVLGALHPTGKNCCWFEIVGAQTCKCAVLQH